MNQAHHPQKTSIKSILSFCLISTALSQALPAKAQITPDNTLGTEASQLNQNLLINGALGDKIDGGATRGSNLFHSFSEFNIQDGQRVYFNNPTGVENILTRVTGGNASNIFGTLGVDGAANLFLINPNGILFGENAQLDVQGSFVGTTANGVQFGNQGNFSATNPQAPPLLTVNPSVLFFNQLNQGGITNQSQAPAGINPVGENVTGLRVANGQNLLLVGGNINIDGGAIRAFGGNVELAAFAAPGTVGLNITDNNLPNLVIPDGVERADVSLSNGAEVNVRGVDGGNIKINARNVNLTGQSKLRAGIDIGLGTPNSQGGDVVINATGTTTLTELSFIANVIQERAFGKSGDVNITTGSLNLVNNSQLSASTYGQGNAGSVLIQAKDGVLLTGGAIIKSSVEQGAVGNSGSIEIQTASLSLTQGSEINTKTLGQGDGGNIAINARETISLDGFGNNSNIFSRIISSVNPSGVGNAGDIQVTTGSLSVNNGAFISSSTLGIGDAGNIIIDARDTINFDRDTSIESNVYTGVVGKGGDIQITTGSLAFTNGAFISSGTNAKGNAGNIIINARDTVTFDGVGSDGYYSSANSIALSNAIANGGNIRINAGALFLTNGGQLNVYSAGQGNAGSIFLDTRDTVIVDGIGSNGLSSSVYSFATESGNGGEIQVNTGTLSLTNGGILFSSAQRNAGNITINARDAVILDGVARNEISSGVFSYLNNGGVGKAGDIQITTNSFTALNGGVLLSSTFGKGKAGNITINARDTVTFDGVGSNQITSGAVTTVLNQGEGKGGNIDINATSLSLTNGATLATSTSAQGDAGNVNVQVTGAVDISGDKNGFGFTSEIRSFVNTGAVGNGGKITIDSGSFLLRDGAQLNAATFGQGNAGNVTVRASDFVSLAGANIFSTVGVGGVGQGGNIDINATSLSLTDGATLATSTSGRGDAGNVNVQVTGAVDIAGFASGIRSFVNTGAVGNGGNITIDSGSFLSRDGAQMNAATFGQGNAGNVTVRASDFVSLTDASIFSTVEAGGVGNGGNIDINATSVSLTDSAQLLTITRSASATKPAGQGDAGDVNVNVTGAVDISGEKNGFTSGIRSFVDIGTVGNGGNIDIKAGSISLNDSALIQSSTYGKGDAGNIQIQTNDLFTGRLSLLNNVLIAAESFSPDGAGGNININVGQINAENGGQVSTGSGRQFQEGNYGRGGNLTVTASDFIELDGVGNNYRSGFFAETSSPSRAGDLTVNTNKLVVRNGAGISAGASGSGSLGGNGGNLTINATESINLIGTTPNYNSTFATEANGLGNAGKLTINTSRFNVRDGATISTFVAPGNNTTNKFTIGNGGDIEINVDALKVTNGGQINASTYGQGNAGNVTINAREQIAFDGSGGILGSGVFSQVGDTGIGKGGDIRITTRSLSVTNAAALVTRSSGQGDAGNIQINASDSVNISGNSRTTGYSSGLFTSTLPNSTGKGGNIAVDTNILRVSQGGLVDARTRNDGTGGDIAVKANSVELANGGQILTTTSGSGSAGKININANTEVVIDGIDATFNDRLSKIGEAPFINVDAASGFFVRSTSVGRVGDIEINSPQITLDNQGKLNAESASGNGGNINANSDLLFLRRGAQISTNAGTEKLGGDGGDININSRFIVAIPDENSDISANAFTGTGGNIQINSQGIFGIEARTKLTQESDITASSELGVSGVTNINTPDNSSIQNSFTGLSPIIDTNALIANSCISRGTKRQENSFTITGSGALTTNRPGILVSNYTTGEVRGVETTSRPWKKGDPIIEPQGLYRLPNGQLILSRSC